MAGEAAAASRSGGGLAAEGDASAAQSSEADAASRPAALYKPLVWVDLEMTGLDPNVDTILEIAVIVTDGHIRERIEGPELCIHHADVVLENMNEWSAEHHAASGLTEACRESDVSLKDAERRVLDFVKSYVPEPRVGLLAGNSVHADAAFLRAHMPDLSAHLHYRIVDVTSIKEVTARWLPNVAKRAPRKSNNHRALADIRESIDELAYLQRAVFDKAKAQRAGGGSSKGSKSRGSSKR